MSSNLRAGAYRAVITPPLGVGLEGSFSFRGAESVLDDLHVNALVVDDGRNRVAIASVDACIIPHDMIVEISEQIHAKCGMPVDNIFISATHTHSGPLLGLFGFAGEADAPYIDLFKRQVASAVQLAQQRAQPVAQVGVGRGENRDHVFNRRLRAPDSRILMNWIDPALLEGCEPSGPVDPELVAVKFVGECGTVIATIVNYANHNNAAPGASISSDMAGHMGKLLRRIYGEETVVVFLLGACGNTNWLNHQDPRSRLPTWYQNVGTSVAGTVLQADAMRACPEVQSVGVRRTTLPIPDRPYRGFDVIDDGTFGPNATAFFKAYREAKAAGAGQELPVNPVDIGLITIGREIAIVTAPVEAFCEIALEIKSRSPYTYTLFAELTNGAFGYVPTRQAFDEGGYEIRKVPGNSHLAMDAAERIIEAGVALLEEAKGRAP
jgi:neutral ceramidase